MEEKKLTNTQTFFKSFINNRVLFERRKNSIWFPIIILMLIVVLLSVPSYIVSRAVKGDSLMRNFPEVQLPLEKLLTSSLDCRVKDGILTCEDDAPALNIVIGDEVKYTVIANQKSIALDTQVSQTSRKDTDNLIIVYNQTIRIRYTQRDLVSQTVSYYEIVGDYSTLEGFDFKKTGERLANDPNLISIESENFILQAYRSTLDTKLLIDIVNSLLSFLLLTLVTCIVIKSPYVFKRKKGFKFSECFKISLTSTLPCIILSLLLSFVFGFNTFPTILGFLYVLRIMYIYFKYIFTNKIFKEIYSQDNEERFNV